MKKFTLLLILLTSFAGFSQTVLEDFESTLPASALVEDLGTAVTVVPDPATSGTNGNVLKVVTSDGTTAQTYQNAQYFFQNDGLDLSTTNKVVTIDVYSEIATSILVKVEDAIGGAVAKQTDASHDGAGWQTLSFNFDTANAVYGRLVIFPLWNGVDDFDTKSVTTTYYDNITGIAYAPPAQNITVSVDISETAGGVTIRVYNAELEGFDEIAATIDPNDSNKFSHTFPAGVTSATYAWRLYPSATPTDESLVSLVGGGAVENNLAAFLGDNNGIDTDYANYCSRTVASTTGNYVAPTFYFNSFRQVGVEYTKLVLTAAQGSNIVIDYSLNEFDESHGPGATDNGDGTYTAIVNPTSTFEYMWNNLTTSTQEDLLTCTNGIGVNTDNANYANRTHAAGEDKADTFNVCPSNAQTITVSVDVSEFDGDPGVNIAVYNGTGFDEYTATVDTTNPKKFNYTFADGVTTATYYWVTYTGPFGVGESLVSLVGGGAIENNLAATLGANNGIASDYGSYCNRTVTSDTGVYVAPTFYHNSFRQVGVTYTELVLTAASGGSYAIDYSINNFDQYHGPGATDNGDGTYTVIVDPSSTFEYMWNNLTVGREDLLSCTDGVGVNTDNTTYANRTHAAGEDKADTFNVCPLVPEDPAPQNVVQDFETGTDGLGEGFGGAVAEIVADPETGGTRGQVAKLTAAATGEVWQGININIESNVQLTTDKTMRLDVYSETAISIAPRVQGGVANAPTSTGVVSHTGSGWETLTVTFNTGSNGDATAEGEYAEFVIYYLWDNGFIAPAVDRIFYVDNIKGISTEAAVDTSLPTTAAPSPTNSDVTILSIYNDTGSFTGISQVWSQEYDFGTNQGNKDLDPTEGVNNALKMDFSATGYGAGAAVTDISNQTHLHFDYYAPAGDAGVNGHEFKFIIIGDGQGEKDYFFKTSGGDAVIEFDQWVSIDIPLSHYEALGFTKDKFLQYKLGSTSDLNTKVVYFDNIYFYNDANLGLDSSNALSMSLYPSPAKNELKISAENKIDTASIYNILGRKVKSFSVNAKTSSLDVSSLSTGIYILKYISNNVVGSMKFIKE